MRDICVRNYAIKAGASDFLGLSENGIVNRWVFGDFNETSGSHLGTRPPNEELINLRIDLLFVTFSSQRAAALLTNITHHRTFFLGRVDIRYEIKSWVG